MNIEWQSFIGSAQDRPGRPRPDKLFDLSPLGGLRIQGKDAASFAQGQFTNDIEASTHKRAQLSAWCSPKGRVLMSFWIYARDDGFVLSSAVPITETLSNRLKLYVLRAKVDIDNELEGHVRLGCEGALVSARLEDYAGPLPIRIGEVTQTPEGLSIMRTFGEERFELFAPTATMTTVWPMLSEVAALQPASAWALGDIENGVPVVGAEVTDEYLPQMLNLMELGAISLEKGCYVGQEIVARAHYRGKVKRRMYMAAIDTPMLNAGDEVLSKDDEARVVGRVLAAATDSDGRYRAQVVLNVTDAGTDLQLTTGDTLNARQPPYDLDSGDSPTVP